VGVSLTSMSMLFGIGRYAYTNFGMRFLMAIFVIIFGLVIVRVYSELLIVIFKIHDNLKKSQIKAKSPQIIKNILLSTNNQSVICT
jgi:hypothetical protein